MACESECDRQSSAQVLSLNLHPGDEVLSDAKPLILETKEIISKAQKRKIHVRGSRRYINSSVVW